MLIKVTPNKENVLKYSKKENAFYGSEKHIQFALRYNVVNTVTGNEKTFEFKYSTGAEFDPNTQWIYESECGMKLIIMNDAAMTAINAENYKKAKLRN